MSEQNHAPKNSPTDEQALQTEDQHPRGADMGSERRLAELERRLARIEKKTKTNEQFARTMSAALSTQVIAVDAVTKIIRRALSSDAQVQDDLSIAIYTYDKHKFRRWLSGIGGILLWIGSVAGAAVLGALIYWLFAVN